MPPSAVEPVAAVLTAQCVRPGASEDDVGSIAACEGIGPTASDDAVGTVGADDRVAGLSGAANVLKSDGIGGTVDGRRLLVAAGAELERLQQMLRPDTAVSPSRPTSVAALLANLAAMHRAIGLTVHLETTGDPEVTMERGALSQVLTNLLVNCARHAPGAPVWLRCRGHTGTVRIEVADAGPGLPIGAAASVLERGVRGPASSGEGLGLAISADIVSRHGGTLTSSTKGCVARLDLPSSTSDIPLRYVGA